MKIRFTSKFGGAPVELEATQLIVTGDDGTPVMVAGEYGPAGAIKAAHAADADFVRVLRTFGYTGSVEVEIARLPGPPPGAQRLFDTRR